MFRPLLIIFFALTFFNSLLNAQAILSGQVTDERGRPLAGANVFIPQLQRGTPTDAGGLFRITGLSPGAYTLEVSFIGYATVYQSFEVGEKAESVLRHVQMAERSVVMETLLVSATRAGAKTPMTYTNLSKSQLEANNLGQDVPYLLRWTPSAVVTSDAGTGIGYTGIRIRGSDPTRINVTINGIPLNDAESQSVYWVDLPDFVSSANDVQIQRGVGTSTNGAGAFGATINLNTAQLNREPYLRLNGSVGSFNTWKSNIQFGTGMLADRFVFDGRLSRISSDGYIDRARADLQSWFLSGAYIGRKSSLRFNAFSGHEVTYQAWNGVPAEYVDDPVLRTYNSAGTEKPGEPHDNEVDDYRQTHYQLLYNLQPAPRWEMSLALHYTLGAGYFEQYKAGQSFEGYGFEPLMFGDSIIDHTDLIRRRWLDNDFYGAVYALRYASSDQKLKATLGGSLHRYKGRHFGEVIWARYASLSETGARYYDNDAVKTDVNVYTKIEYQLLPALHAFLDLQWREVDYDFLGINNNLQRVPQGDALRFFNPKGGLHYQINDRSEAYASFAVGSREPNRNDYTENPAGARPRPEYLYNTELGYRHQGQKASLGLNIYHMYYRDQLALNGRINDVGEYIRSNIERSYRLGIEIAGGLQMNRNLSLEGNATLSRNRVLNFTEFIDNYDTWPVQVEVVHKETDLAFSPALIAGAGLTWDCFAGIARLKDHQLELNLSGKYIGRQYLDNTSDEDNVLAPYFFSDLRVKYTLRSKWLKEIGFTLLVQNLLDNLYETNGWSYRYVEGAQTYLLRGLYPQAGRNVLLGINVSF